MTLRWRLTFLYAAAAFLIVLAACFAAYGAYRLGSLSMADRTLMQAVDEITDLAEAQTSVDPARFRERLAAYSDNHETYFIQASDALGHPIFQSDADDRLPSVGDVGRDQASGRMRLWTFSLPNRTERRIASGFIARSRGGFRLQIGVPLPKTLWLLSGGPAIGTMVFFALVVFFLGWAGWWVAGRALEPIDLANRRLHQFTSNVSHQLKTPLAILRGEIEVALDTHAPLTELRAVLSSNLAEIENLCALVEDLLTYARMENETNAVPTSQRLDPLIEEIGRKAALLARQKSQTVQLKLAGPLRARVQPVRLEQAALNVIENAVRHTPEGGCITLRLDKEAAQAVLSIQDSGPGISAEDLGSLFKRGFSRHGTGIGLALARSLVESFSGTIEAVSPPGAGLCVRIRMAES
jgi:signal transduction histidine kinase